MTYFSINPGHVRGDLFTKHGKWKYTITIDMSNHYYDPQINSAVIRSVRSTPERLLGVYSGVVSQSSEYVLVVLDPYHENSFPQMLKLWEYK